MSLQSELAPLPAMIADRPRLRTMLASLARTLHVGPLADCFSILQRPCVSTGSHSPARQHR